MDKDPSFWTTLPLGARTHPVSLTLNTSSTSPVPSPISLTQTTFPRPKPGSPNPNRPPTTQAQFLHVLTTFTETQTHLSFLLLCQRRHPLPEGAAVLVVVVLRQRRGRRRDTARTCTRAPPRTQHPLLPLPSTTSLDPVLANLPRRSTTSTGCGVAGAANWPFAS